MSRRQWGHGFWAGFRAGREVQNEALDLLQRAADTDALPELIARYSELRQQLPAPEDITDRRARMLFLELECSYRWTMKTRLDAAIVKELQGAPAAAETRS